MQVCKYAILKVCLYASMLAYKYGSMQGCKFLNSCAEVLGSWNICALVPFPPLYKIIGLGYYCRNLLK